MLHHENTRENGTWNFTKFEQFIIDSIKNNGEVTLHPINFPRNIDFGNYGTMTDYLTQLTISDGPISKRKERSQHITYKDSKFQDSVIKIGEQTKVKGFDPLQFKDRLVFLAHSHPLPVTVAPTDLLLLRLPSLNAPIGMSVGTEHKKVFVFRSSLTQPLNNLKEINPKGLLDFIRTLYSFGTAIDKYIENDFLGSLTLAEKELIKQSTKQPGFWEVDSNVAAINRIHDVFLRNEAQKNGYVIYSCNIGSQNAVRCKLDQPILITS